MKLKTMFAAALIWALSFSFSITASAQTAILGETEISFEQAMEIAAKRVEGGTITEIEWEGKYGMLVYDVEIYNKGMMKYDVGINAVTGEIIQLNSKRMNYSQTPVGLPTAQVTSNRSIELTEISLKEVGGGTVTEIAWEVKDGQPICKIKVNSNGRRHEIRIDAATGEIVKLKSK